ncbi:ENTR1-like protein [Mya arenaria]|uniref:Endosome-associated-trafficking regulator 1 n=1 Tax=Mya arenaria TaxID=6604 RepID=A0ABY7EXU5_MYAAR|nr:ENTR1-like protein [Mya arenaria]
MAEGGEKSDENNPFSFKSFVTKKDKSVTEHEKPSNEDDLDIFNTPDLQDENRALRQQVEELKRRNHQCDNRVGDLERQLERQKAKEAEENAVMERAMEQVEENLSQTTKRAVQAETMVTKLKQDVKGLQAEMGKLRGENRMLLSGDKYLGDIKERTGYVAEQLSSATNTAETSLKQLLSGLDQLKMLSLVLTSIDKITEDTSSSDSSKPNA